MKRKTISMCIKICHDKVLYSQRKNFQQKSVKDFTQRGIVDAPIENFYVVESGRVENTGAEPSLLKALIKLATLKESFLHGNEVYSFDSDVKGNKTRKYQMNN